jgi:hypothetical protein
LAAARRPDAFDAVAGAQEKSCKNINHSYYVDAIRAAIIEGVFDSE